MRTNHGQRLITLVLAITTGACAESGQQRAEGGGDSSRIASRASAARDNGNMQGMTGMEGMTGQGGELDSSMAGSPGAVRSQMMAMTGATADGMKAMLPKHRQLVANMIARMNTEMREMQMRADAEWSSVVDSLRTDLVQMPELSASELKGMMPGHMARVTRLQTMHATMMRAMTR